MVDGIYLVRNRLSCDRDSLTMPADQDLSIPCKHNIAPFLERVIPQIAERVPDLAPY